MSVTATERRSQYLNRVEALSRLREGLKQLTWVPKPRKKTKPTRGSQERRLRNKRAAQSKKQQRRKEFE